MSQALAPDQAVQQSESLEQAQKSITNMLQKSTQTASFLGMSGGQGLGLHLFKKGGVDPTKELCPEGLIRTWDPRVNRPRSRKTLHADVSGVQLWVASEVLLTDKNEVSQYEAASAPAAKDGGGQKSTTQRGSSRSAHTNTREKIGYLGLFLSVDYSANDVFGKKTQTVRLRDLAAAFVGAHTRPDPHHAVLMKLQSLATKIPRHVQLVGGGSGGFLERTLRACSVSVEEMLMNVHGMVLNTCDGPWAQPELSLEMVQTKINLTFSVLRCVLTIPALFKALMPVFVERYGKNKWMQALIRAQETATEVVIVKTGEDREYDFSHAAFASIRESVRESEKSHKKSGLSQEVISDSQSSAITQMLEKGKGDADFAMPRYDIASYLHEDKIDSGALAAGEGWKTAGTRAKSSAEFWELVTKHSLRTFRPKLLNVDLGRGLSVVVGGGLEAASTHTERLNLRIYDVRFGGFMPPLRDAFTGREISTLLLQESAATADKGARGEGQKGEKCETPTHPNPIRMAQGSH